MITPAGVTGTIVSGPAVFVDAGCGGGFALLPSDALGAGAGAGCGVCSEGCGVEVCWIVGTSEPPLSDAVGGVAVAVTVSALLTAGDEALSADGESLGSGATDGDGAAGGVEGGVMVTKTMVGSNGGGDVGLAD